MVAVLDMAPMGVPPSLPPLIEKSQKNVILIDCEVRDFFK